MFLTDQIDYYPPDDSSRVSLDIEETASAYLVDAVAKGTQMVWLHNMVQVLWPKVPRGKVLSLNIKVSPTSGAVVTKTGKRR